ncbi:MAG: branched-chain amino acid ABC transporter permease [Candidatus Bathyarchaeia archaeon]
MAEIATPVQVIANALLLGGVYALIAAGFNVIYGVMDVINCAQADMMMIAMYIGFWMFELYGAHPLLATFIAVPLLFAVGMLTQRVVIDRLLGAPLFIQAIATIGLGYAIQNLALLFWREDYRMIWTEYTTSTIDVGFISLSFPRLVAFASSLLIIAILYFILTKTDFGRIIRATSQNREAAMLMGINVKRVYAIVFGIGVACAGIAGVLTSTFYYIYPTVGSVFLLRMFVVVVLGGCGNVLASIAGGLIVGFSEGVGAFVLSPSWKEAIYMAVFLIVLAIKPTGIFGEKKV